MEKIDSKLNRWRNRSKCMMEDWDEMKQESWSFFGGHVYYKKNYKSKTHLALHLSLEKHEIMESSKQLPSDTEYITDAWCPLCWIREKQVCTGNKSCNCPINTAGVVCCFEWSTIRDGVVRNNCMLFTDGVRQMIARLKAEIAKIEGEDWKIGNSHVFYGDKQKPQESERDRIAKELCARYHETPSFPTENGTTRDCLAQADYAISLLAPLREEAVKKAGLIGTLSRENWELRNELKKSKFDNKAFPIQHDKDGETIKELRDDVERYKESTVSYRKRMGIWIDRWRKLREWLELLKKHGGKINGVLIEMDELERKVPNPDLSDDPGIKYVQETIKRLGGEEKPRSVSKIEEDVREELRDRFLSCCNPWHRLDKENAVLLADYVLDLLRKERELIKDILIKHIKKWRADLHEELVEGILDNWQVKID